MNQTVLETKIPPEWNSIDGLREEVLRRLGDDGLSTAKAYSVSMVASELLENAVKYGDFEPGDEVFFHLTSDPTRLTLEVRNPTSEEKLPHLEKMDRMIQWIRGYQDPFQAYLARLGEVARLSIQNPESGLGLVRAAYEGDAILDFYLGEGGSLAVFAIFDR